MLRDSNICPKMTWEPVLRGDKKTYSVDTSFTRCWYKGYRVISLGQKVSQLQPEVTSKSDFPSSWKKSKPVSQII